MNLQNNKKSKQTKTKQNKIKKGKKGKKNHKSPTRVLVLLSKYVLFLYRQLVEPYYSFYILKSWV
jgi:hypothetical protein